MAYGHLFLIIITLYLVNCIQESILKRIRIEEVSYLGVEIPSRRIYLEKHSEFITTTTLVAKKYSHLQNDIKWLISHRHYGVLKEILLLHHQKIDTDSLFTLEYVHSFFQSIATVGDSVVYNLLFKTFYNRLKDYLVGLKLKKSLDNVIPTYLGTIIQSHGNIDIWKSMIGFVSDCFPTMKTIKSRLPSVLYHLKDGDIKRLIHQCIVKGRLEILDDIITSLKDRSVFSPMSSSINGQMPVGLYDQSDSVFYPPPNLESRNKIKTILEYLYVNLPNQLFYKIVDESPLVVMSNNTNILFYYFDKDPVYYAECYFFYNHLYQDTNLDEVKMQHTTLSLLLTHYQDKLNIDIKSIDSVIQAKEDEFNYYLFWLVEAHYKFLKLHKSTFKIISDRIQSSQQQIIRFINNHFDQLVEVLDQWMKLLDYILERFGFEMIYWYGDLKLVKESYNLIKNKIRVDQDKVKSDNLLIKHKLLDQSGLFESMVTWRWDIVEFLVLETDISFRSSPRLLQDALSNGYFLVADRLLETNPYLPQTLNSSIVSVNSVEMATYFQKTRPQLSQDNQKNITLTKYFLDRHLEEPHFEFPSFINDLSKNSHYLPVIEYIDHYLKQNSKSGGGGFLKSFIIPIDSAIKRLDIELIKCVVDLGIPFEVTEFTPWQTVGQYGSMDWVETLLLNNQPMVRIGSFKLISVLF
ncbi:hypothetical protein DFA_10760 [Cavenderia fasciculata]|uniref:Uncharacterized protein n=1 Tax=Cavenderia fasciculata TaxID=261658 RepID=F4QBB5_CACFS|nr:uncharacterized protein DFA_10760 [Cavenderia fasciculata]EGG14887.1 hypothetical protein DFA_10760 [Cavenderia fasciculata]|eukprot:XP_004351403.1 hypothetical protein DFA_10760 [Cavenderia fasciculata]